MRDELVSVSEVVVIAIFTFTNLVFVMEEYLRLELE
jgi:hypothetical protein